ncbi:MAG: enoyl-CoA hydratase/isomerase family protein [Dehalococcoidia bacterium]
MGQVLFEIDDRGVATITLNRPEKLNAINMPMRDELWEHLRACSDIPEVQVILFRGAGACFSAGADISEFGTAPSVMASREARHRRDVWDALLHHRCTTIAALHGHCFGAGLELPLYCDIRIASEGATFGLPEVSLGYIPSAGATQMLPRLIPPGVAASMIISGEPIDTVAARRWGLIDRVVPQMSFDNAIEEEVVTPLKRGTGQAQDRRRRLIAETSAPAAASIR